MEAVVEEKIEVDKDELIKATTDLMDWCQSQGMSELLAYMAMTTLTKKYIAVLKASQTQAARALRYLAFK